MLLRTPTGVYRFQSENLRSMQLSEKESAWNAAIWSVTIYEQARGSVIRQIVLCSGEDKRTAQTLIDRATEAIIADDAMSDTVINICNITRDIVLEFLRRDREMEAEAKSLEAVKKELLREAALEEKSKHNRALEVEE